MLLLQVRGEETLTGGFAVTSPLKDHIRRNIIRPSNKIMGKRPRRHGRGGKLNYAASEIESTRPGFTRFDAEDDDHSDSADTITASSRDCDDNASVAENTATGFSDVSYADSTLTSITACDEYPTRISIPQSTRSWAEVASCSSQICVPVLAYHYRYIEVHVVMFYWEDNDLNIGDGFHKLRRVFRHDY